MTVIFKKWPEQELFGGMMLQYDLSNALEESISIPFRIIQWLGCREESEYWNEIDTEIECVMIGTIIWEGIKHANFCVYDEGYINYPDIKNLSLCLNRLHELCLKYCSYYE